VLNLKNIEDSFGSLKSLLQPFAAASVGAKIAKFSFSPVGLVLKLIDLISTTADSLNALENVKGSVQEARNHYVQTVREYLKLKRAYEDHVCDEPEDPDIHPKKPGPRRGIGVFFSTDPNEILSTGVGQYGAVRPGDVISYTVNFENLASATAPAQVVKINLPLSSQLDWSSLELTGLGFNDVNLAIPAGLRNYETTVTSTSDPNHPVMVTIHLNPVTGELTASLQSIDPVTGEATSDPFAGFLPPNNATGQGRGYLTFDIKTKTSLAAGTEVRNQAVIIFDANAPLATNQSLNTIDTEAPVSQVNSLPSTTTSNTFTVTWTGNDPRHGAGVSTYDVFVSVNNGPFTLWMDDTAATAALFTGVKGSSYSFYSVASDGLGYIEAIPSTGDVTITVLANLKPVVERIELANGAAQRSKFIYVRVVFNTMVTFNKNAFELYLNGKRFTISSIFTSTEDGHTVATLQFSQKQLPGLSLPDGTYKLVTIARHVKASVGGMSMESNRTDQFFRLFGDVDGNGRLDQTDLDALHAAMNKKAGQAGYLNYLDFDNNGRIDSKDMAAFNKRRNVRLP
jgi:hypothetical protein